MYDVNKLLPQKQFEKLLEELPTPRQKKEGRRKGHIENTAGRRKKIINLDRIYVSLDLRRRMRNKGTKINMQMRGRDYKRKRGPKFKFEASKYKVRFLLGLIIVLIRS